MTSHAAGVFTGMTSMAAIPNFDMIPGITTLQSAPVSIMADTLIGAGTLMPFSTSIRDNSHGIVTETSNTGPTS